MRYKSFELYQIEPKELSNMTHMEALIMCKQKAIAHKANLVHDKQNVQEWDTEKEALIKYLSKTILWCDEKIKEME